MSQSALLTTVRDTLRSQVPLSEDECRVMPDGQPFPGFGDRFVAVHPASWRPGDTTHPGSGLSLDEVYGVSCTLTQRAPLAPVDRFMDDLYLTAVTGMEALARSVVMVVHANWTLMTAANALLSGTDLFIEPLQWVGSDAGPRPEGVQWVWSTESDEDLIAALVMEIRFDGARRLQASTRGFT